MRIAAHFVLLLAAAQVSAAEVEVTVAAGKHDRTNTPVRVLLPGGAVKDAGDVAVLRGRAGVLKGQLTERGLLAGDGEGRELHFVLPQLKSGESERFTVTFPGSTTPADGFAWKREPGQFSELSFDRRPILRYVCLPLDDSTPAKREETYKVFHHLYDPTGKQLLTKGPGGKFTHHRGLFYAFNQVTYDGAKKVDIWHCKDDTHQRHDADLASAAGAVVGRHRVRIGWHGQKKELFAVEDRELTVWNVPDGTLVEFASRLTPVKGSVKLDGDPQHAGFHVRAAGEVADKTSAQTYFLRPDGKDQPGKTRNWPQDKAHINLPWDAMSFVVAGTRYTAAYLDRPTNPKEARFSERDYGRFGSYFVAECSPQKPLVVAYRVWVREGESRKEDVATRAADFVEPVEVTVK